MSNAHIFQKADEFEQRIKTIEEKLGITPPQPTPSLIEAVEGFILGCNAVPEYQDIKRLSASLEKEKRIAEKREIVIGAARQNTQYKYYIMNIQKALEAYDEEAAK